MAHTTETTGQYLTRLKLEIIELKRQRDDLLAASIPLANEGTLYLLPGNYLRCACCNVEPQKTLASKFEHSADCPVEDLRDAIVKAERK